jgi:SAM-dependent methyltransferase
LSANLAHRAALVDAIDRAPAMVSAARARVPANVSVRLAAIEDVRLAPAHYDAVVSVAVLHHLTLSRVLPRLVDALRPGAVLVALGLPRRDLVNELPTELAATVLHHAIGVLRAARGEQVGPRFRTSPDHTAMPVAEPVLTTREVRAVAARLLPGVRVRRLALWRYLLVWHRPLV